MKTLKNIKDYLRTLNNERRARRLINQSCQMTKEGFLFSGRGQYFSPGGYEAYQTELVKAILNRVELFVNVGAHHGYYCCLALKNGIKTIAFEPHPMNVAMLNKHVCANNFSEKFQLFESAVGATEGQLQFFGSGFTGSLLSTIHPGTPTQDHQLVDVLTLDSTVKNENCKKLIVMDVEGYENEVLKGAASLLNEWSYWLIEILPNHGNATPFASVFELMDSHSYSAWGLDEGRQSIQKFTVPMAKEIDTNKATTEITNFLFLPNGDAIIENLFSDTLLK